jgi:hypothetical protein
VGVRAGSTYGGLDWAVTLNSRDLPEGVVEILLYDDINFLSLCIIGEAMVDGATRGCVG